MSIPQIASTIKWPQALCPVVPGDYLHDRWALIPQRREDQKPIQRQR